VPICSWGILSIGIYAFVNLCSMGLAQSLEEDIPAAVTEVKELPDPHSTFQAGVRMFEDGFYLQAQEVFKEWLRLFPPMN
jgi:hypothetical protein